MTTLYETESVPRKPAFDLYLISLPPMRVLPAHGPVLPEAGVLAGIVLVTPCRSEIVPFWGFW